MLQSWEDIDSTSQSHIQNALQRAITYDKNRKDACRYTCAVSNLELKSLSTIIEDNKKFEKVIEKSNRKTRLDKETISRSKVVRKSSSNKSFGPKSQKWVKHKHKRNRESIVTLADEICLEPHVVSPFYANNNQKHSTSFPKRKLSCAKSAPISFLPDIQQSKNVEVFREIQSKRNKPNKVTRIDVTLPSILDKNSGFQESADRNLITDPFENQDNFHQIVKEILRKTSDSVALPGKTINLSHIYQVFADKTYMQASQNILDTKQRKQIHHNAIARYYNQKEQLENHPVFIIHLPSPDELSSDENSIRTFPKFFMRFASIFSSI